MLIVILENIFFSYKGFIYRQVAGLLMGNSLSSILAMLFMDKRETSRFHVPMIGTLQDVR